MRAVFLPLALVLCSLTPAPAQPDTSERFAIPMTYTHTSGSWQNPGTTPLLAHTHTVTIASASSLRVFFSELVLGPADRLDVIGLQDSEIHGITALEAQKWSRSSAYFNGGSLRFELWVAPGSSALFTVRSLLVGLPPLEPDSLCGADDRIASTDYRACRFLNGSGSAACTGWLASSDDCAFSAGHCFPTYFVTAEFAPPQSTSGGSLQHPPINFQYPIDNGTVSSTSGGTGNDWGMCKLHPNNLGESATANFGFYTLDFMIPNPGETIRITGYGSDDGTTNQTLQTNDGPYFGTNGTRLRYTVDTTGGNSGSPVIHESTGLAIGIHTHGGCASGYNTGTSLTNTGFQTAWQALCVPPPPSFSLDAVTSGGGAGDLTLELLLTPPGVQRGLTLVSFDVSGPAGEGNIFGIAADLVTLALISTTADPFNPWHFRAPFTPGIYPAGPLVFAPGTLPFPAGTMVDLAVVVFDGSYGYIDHTPTERVTF